MLPSCASHTTSSIEDGAVTDTVFLEIWGTDEEMKEMNQELSHRETEAKLFSKEIKEKYQARKQSDSCFRRHLERLGARRMNFTESQLGLPAAYRSACNPPVFLTVRQELVHTVNDYLDQVDQHIIKFLKDFDPSKSPNSRGWDCTHFLQARESGKVNLLFAVTGSGKTRKIELLLSEHWGFYLLPCNHPPTKTDELYEPRRMNGSNDTWTLWQTFQNIRTIQPKVDVKRIPTEDWYKTLLFSRTLILDRFLRLTGGDRDPKGPAK